MTAPEAILTVGAWQDSGVPGDAAANMATNSRATAQASRRGVHLLVFPECFSTGYYNSERVEQVARQVDPDTFSSLQAVAKSNATAILVGYYETQGGGLYNAALLIGDDGAILANYRKRALYANRIGAEHELRYVGRSTIYDPRGTSLAEATEDCQDLLVATVAKSIVDTARTDISYLEEIGKVTRVCQGL